MNGIDIPIPRCKFILNYANVKKTVYRNSDKLFFVLLVASCC